MAVVSTGQITIVDNNDAKPITLFISANKAVQQVSTKNDTAGSYVPDYAASALVLTPKIYVGGVASSSDISASTVQVINRRWGTTVGGSQIWNGTAATQDTTNFVNASGVAVAAPFTVAANGVTLSISGNLKEATTNYPIVFEADYKDTATGLISHIIATIELSVVKTGTNAVYVQVRGANVIEESTTATKNKVALCADLIRAAGIDRANLEYKWYQIVSGTANQIDANYPANVTSAFSFSDTAATANPVPTAALGTAIPLDGAVMTYNSSGVGVGNTITIAEIAVTDIGLFRVDIKDTAENLTYSGYFTVYDISDPYSVELSSSTGDKLPNGVGSTTISTKVYNGATLVNTTGWTFTWAFFARDGQRSGFVDKDGNTAAIQHYNSGAGRTITANAGVADPYTITYDNSGGLTALSVATNNMVKVVKDGYATYYEITAATAGTVTLKSAGLTNLSLVDYPMPGASSLVGGVLYACTLNGVRTGSSIVVTGEDIDVKGRITCDANRP